jgi:hypothetical protein
VALASRSQIKAQRLACGDSDEYVESDAEESTASWNKVKASLPGSNSLTNGKLVIEVRRVDTICEGAGRW